MALARLVAVVTTTVAERIFCTTTATYANPTLSLFFRHTARHLQQHSKPSYHLFPSRRFKVTTQTPPDRFDNHTTHHKSNNPSPRSITPRTYSYILNTLQHHKHSSTILSIDAPRCFCTGIAVPCVLQNTLQGRLCAQQYQSINQSIDICNDCVIVLLKRSSRS